MSYQYFVLLMAFTPSIQVIPAHSHSNVLRRHTNRDSKIGNDSLSTEAIIGVIGVVVAVLGITSSLAWTKRTESRGRSCRALSLSTADVYSLSNRPTHTYPFITSQATPPWHLALGGDERIPQQQRQRYYIQYERMVVHRLA
ncbi:hypothetical protein BKA58DRAFT_184302 [Alternaria rosae]|uniref:uncharacterized protein n=1 Tax=Alternaria rosae TaxID=1187941 RepID=UPI001E8D34CE|nr:uncharacterized protein BKA58DRAFT_184302 [Alternaria rosae]KAH6870795.1 hypothetical protein BKA58DRAFT_184302 [Alternaria rosae]